MATPIIPKSEMRINNNMIVGFGELPAVVIDEEPGWGLPDGTVTFCRETAKDYARTLDQLIRANLKDSKRLL